MNGELRTKSCLSFFLWCIYSSSFLVLGSPFLVSVAHADYHIEELTSSGTIEGTVFFPGETPPPAMFAAGDPLCPHGIAQNHLLVRQINLALQNAVVILDIDHGVPIEPARGQLATEGCMLTPRIQWLPAGSSLQLKNEDGADHDIHAFQQDVTAFDVPLRGKETVARRPLIHLGFYKINCQHHLWERAWIYVSEHPYVAITDSDGHFVIPNVPPGRYSIRVWHEGWTETDKDPDGRIEYIPMGQTREVKVVSNRIAQVIFDSLEPLP